MKSEILSQFQWIGLTCAGLFIFFTLFLSVMFWVFRKDSRSFYEKVAKLPLNGETHEQR